MSTVKECTRNACAVCKFQRRKCAPNCPLAPYFPSDEQEIFALVHSLYGVSSLTRILSILPLPQQKDSAARSIVYECQARKNNPEEGCVYLLNHLRINNHMLDEEIRLVNNALNRFKNQNQNQNQDVFMSQMQFQTPNNNNNNGFGVYTNSSIEEIVNEQQQLWEPSPPPLPPPPNCNGQFNPNNIVMQSQITGFQEGQELYQILENHGGNSTQSHENVVVHDQGFFGQYAANTFETRENLINNYEANEVYQFHPPPMTNYNEVNHQGYPPMTNNEANHQGYQFHPTTVNNIEVNEVFQLHPTTVNNEINQVFQFHPITTTTVNNEVNQVFQFNPNPNPNPNPHPHPHPHPHHHQRQ
ncbi:LOB domain-containing protein 27-like [Impatiens glandulifera]|uniref:LOB domain-containing protein 27-like n=1 Tax=Impatiens glandulifera TaxID=253017 RepID=UPI001FB094ED|nr:LOB domain-containing protein 27-like [Impatiens glandulifera]